MARMHLKGLLRTIRSMMLRIKGIVFGAKPSEVFVIGTQVANARAAQQRHEQVHGRLPSPLADLHYSNEENRLWRWVESPLDRSIEAMALNFAGLADAERNAMRNSLTMDDFYTLWAYARRSALAVLRSGDPEKLKPAFLAIAMIELERIDWRDLISAVWMVRYAGQRLGVSTEHLVSQAISLAEPQTAKALCENQSGLIDLAQSCGYREVVTSEGVGLFETSYSRFTPKANLAEIGFKIAISLEESGYEINIVEIAGDLPLVWLNSAEGSAVARMVGRFSGCMVIHGAPRGDPETMPPGQSLLVFLAEAASEGDAREIAVAAEAASNSSCSQIGLASGRLCAVIIQRSFMADTPPLEDKRSLERLRIPLEGLLA